MTDSAAIADAVVECIDMQQRLGCDSIILPSPLTADPTSDYSSELVWLDAGLGAARARRMDLPVFATVAISDLCLAYIDPTENSLLDAIIDSVSAREVDGVYIVLEQASEPVDGRLCTNSRTLRSVLELVHAFARDGGLSVGVNFLGPFGLVCYAAGATWWGSAWYKSLIRLRLSDTPGGGRAYPSYWSAPAALEVNLERDFDRLIQAGMLADLSDQTAAASGLLQAAGQGVSANSVPDWRYRPSNVTSAREHYIESQVGAQARAAALPVANRLAAAEQWLMEADTRTSRAMQTLPRGAKTKTGHPAAWFRAVRDYRRDHDL